MSTICDSCRQLVAADDGSARIMINDPSPDFRAISAGALSTFRHPPQLDLCVHCLMKLIEILNLPSDTFTPRQPPALPTGALSEKDLVELGLGLETAAVAHREI